MKFRFLSLILICAVILGCVVTAGCVLSRGASIEPVLFIHFEKAGVAYYPGEVWQGTFPSNPSAGYDWKIVDSGGLIITQEYVHDTSESSGHTVFTVSAATPSTSRFSLAYTKIEGNELPLCTYTGVHVTTAAPDGVQPLSSPRGTLVLTGEINPDVGELVMVTTGGDFKESGTAWRCVVSDGMRQVSEGYVKTSDEFIWIFTADKPDTYQFIAEEIKNGEYIPVSRHEVDITFSHNGDEVSSASGFNKL